MFYFIGGNMTKLISPNDNMALDWTLCIVLPSCNIVQEGCQNKSPQTEWVKINLFSHSSWGQNTKISMTGPKIKVLVRLTFFRGSRGKSVPCLFQFLVAANIPWLMAASLQSLHLFSHHCLLWVCINFLYLSLVRTLVMAFGPNQIIQDRILNHSCIDPLSK